MLPEGVIVLWVSPESVLGFGVKQFLIQITTSFDCWPPKDQGFRGIEPGLAHFVPQFESQANPYCSCCQLVLVVTYRQGEHPLPTLDDPTSYFKEIKNQVSHYSHLQKPQNELAHSYVLAKKYLSCEKLYRPNKKAFCSPIILTKTIYLHKLSNSTLFITKMSYFLEIV